MKGHNTGGYYQCLMYDRLRTFATLHKNPAAAGRGYAELPRISLPRTRLNKGKRDRNEAPCHSRFAQGSGRRTEPCAMGSTPDSHRLQVVRRRDERPVTRDVTGLAQLPEIGGQGLLPLRVERRESPHRRAVVLALPPHVVIGRR